MNRKRLKDESFKDYRTSQNEEAERVRSHLEGTYVHVSKQFTAEGTLLRGVTKVGGFKNG